MFGTVFLLNNAGDIIYRWDNVKSVSTNRNSIFFTDKNRNDWTVNSSGGAIVYAESDELNIGTVWYKNSGVRQSRGEE